MSESMKRRSFLLVVAAGCGGLFASHTAKAQKRPWRPPPRWEWEVGEWQYLTDLRLCQRRWIADVTVTGHDLARIWHTNSLSGSAGGPVVNSHHFCGVLPRNMRIVWVKHTPLRNDLHEACIVLAQHVPTPLWTFRDSFTVNFYDVFRGEHAVVSVGGKEAAGETV